VTPVLKGKATSKAPVFKNNSENQGIFFISYFTNVKVLHTKVIYEKIKHFAAVFLNISQNKM